MIQDAVRNAKPTADSLVEGLLHRKQFVETLENIDRANEGTYNAQAETARVL